ncbi:hypothetical protein THAOC_00904, partial [Thalassiosira oceanica]
RPPPQPRRPVGQVREHPPLPGLGVAPPEAQAEPREHEAGQFVRQRRSHVAQRYDGHAPHHGRPARRVGELPRDPRDEQEGEGRGRYHHAVDRRAEADGLAVKRYRGDHRPDAQEQHELRQDEEREVTQDPVSRGRRFIRIDWISGSLPPTRSSQGVRLARAPEERRQEAPRADRRPSLAVSSSSRATLRRARSMTPAAESPENGSSASRNGGARRRSPILRGAREPVTTAVGHQRACSVVAAWPRQECGCCDKDRHEPSTSFLCHLALVLVLRELREALQTRQRRGEAGSQRAAAGEGPQPARKTGRESRESGSYAPEKLLVQYVELIAAPLLASTQPVVIARPRREETPKTRQNMNEDDVEVDDDAAAADGVVDVTGAGLQNASDGQVKTIFKLAMMAGSKKKEARYVFDELARMAKTPKARNPYKRGRPSGQTNREGHNSGRPSNSSKRNAAAAAAAMFEQRTVRQRTGCSSSAAANETAASASIDQQQATEAAQAAAAVKSAEEKKRYRI